MLENVTKCKKCNFYLIAEELEDHICSKVVDYEIKGSNLWVYDGHSWFPRKLRSITPEFQHPDKTPKDSTEPKLGESKLD